MGYVERGFRLFAATSLNGLRCGSALAIAGVLGFVQPLHAHLALSSSSPAAGERLSIAPTSLQLSFTEPVELALSSLELVGPEGNVLLADLEQAESAGSIEARILNSLTPGNYTVIWRAVGSDGHPVRGEFGFEVGEGAEGTRDASDAGSGSGNAVAGFPDEPSPAETSALRPDDSGSFSSESPLFAAVRWIGYLGLVGTIGSIGLAVLLSTRRLVRGAVPQHYRVSVLLGSATLGILSTCFLLVALAMQLHAQSHALFDIGISADRFARILNSRWGQAWALQGIGTSVALIGLLLARRATRAGWVMAALASLGIVLGLGLGGHAAAVESLPAAAVVSDALHVLGAGVWLGSLLALAVVAMPRARKLDRGEQSRALFELFHAFSPLALTAAAVVVATGVFAASLHLGRPADLWLTEYGRLLLSKVAIVTIVVSAGALNWRRLAPRLDHPGTGDRLRRSAAIELAAAAVVVGLTSFLVAVPPPAHSATPESHASSPLESQ